MDFLRSYGSRDVGPGAESRVARLVVAMFLPGIDRREVWRRCCRTIRIKVKAEADSSPFFRSDSE